MYELAVFVGRFQPFHNGHEHVILKALEKAKKVLVLCGSCNMIPTSRNPFSFEDRKKMIKEAFPSDNIIVEPIGDYPYDDSLWVGQIYDMAKLYCKSNNIVLVGHNKDSSSFYLKKFPLWENIDIQGVNKSDGNLIDATDIRNVIYPHVKSPDIDPSYWTMDNAHHILNEKVAHLVPSSTYKFLYQYMTDYDKFAPMYDEVLHDRNYKVRWGEGPHTTVDAVIIQANHVLLIRRKYTPGKGQLAMPGGFVNPNETLEDAMLRELDEETKIDVPKAVLKNRIVTDDYFANPYRSTRARIITHAFLIDLNTEIERKIVQGAKSPVGFTKVKGGDDAAEAMWVNIEDLRPDMLFEDHYFIIMKMIEKMKDK